MGNHSFDTNVAKEIGVKSAILLDNIVHWWEDNLLNGRNFREDNYWTYNSRRAYAEKFYYLTPREIQLSLEKMEKDGYILVANYNSKKYDRTLWYAITEKTYNLFRLEIKSKNLQNVYWIKQNVKCFQQNVEPIPNTEPYSNTNTEEENKIVVTDTLSFSSEESNLSLEHKKNPTPQVAPLPPPLKAKGGSESTTKVVLAHFDKLILQLGISYTYPKSAAGWKPIHTCCKQIYSEVGADGLNDFFAKIESMCASEIFPFKDKSAITPIFIGSAKVVGMITNYEMVGTTFDAKNFFKLKAEDGIAWRRLHKHLLDVGYTNIMHNNEIVNMAKGGVPCEDGLPKTFDSITFKKLRETNPQRANYYAATRQQQ